MLIELTSLLASSAFALTGSLTFWKVHYWYDFYIPLILFIAGYIFMIFIFWWWLIAFFGLFVKQDKVYERQDKWSKFWFNEGLRYINKHARIKLKIKNIDKIPNTNFLLICNHRSKFDPIIIGDILKKKDIAFITKASNFKIPLGHKFMTGLCYMGVDRDDKIQSLGVMKRSTALLKGGQVSVGCFPEEKRNVKEVLLPFHEGIFSVALSSHTPIVIMTIKNTDKIHHNFPLKKTNVELNILGVMQYEEYMDMTPISISNNIHQLMLNDLNK